MTHVVIIKGHAYTIEELGDRFFPHLIAPYRYYAAAAAVANFQTKQ